jgi:hypothetical protein
MHYRQWTALWAMAALPAAVMAQQHQPHQPTPDVTNPAAPTAPLHYESVFSAYRASFEEDTSPDTVWRSVNDEMGKLGGHAGHMKASADNKIPPSRGSAENAKVDNKAGAHPVGKLGDHSKHH